MNADLRSSYETHALLTCGFPIPFASKARAREANPCFKHEMRGHCPQEPKFARPTLSTARGLAQNPNVNQQNAVERRP